MVGCLKFVRERDLPMCADLQPLADFMQSCEIFNFNLCASMNLVKVQFMLQGVDLQPLPTICVRVQSSIQLSQILLDHDSEEL